MFNFREKGYFFILETVNVKKLFPFAIEGNGGLYLPFSTKEEVVEMVQTILMFPEISNKVEVNLMRDMSKPLVMFPLHQVARSIEEYDTVQLIRGAEFVSHLQPIVSLQNDQVFGFEALLRDPQARISPAKLFEVAQATGLHHLLDMKARQTAINSRVNNIPHGIKSFINFLPSTIYNPQYSLRNTLKYMEQNQVRPEDVVFEVVETEKISDIAHLKDIFHVYRQQGIKVALDDYGSGHATFEVLIQLLPDFVKFDRSLIMNCDQDLEKQNHLIKLVKMVKGLGISSLAEGVERKEELDFCRKIGIDLAQGFYIGKPERKANLLVTAV